MKKTFVVACLLLAGCYTIRTSGNHAFRTEYGKNLKQCTANSVSGVRAKLTNEGWRYKLELVAMGEFVIHEGRQTIRRDIGVPSVSIGMFPGCAANTEGIDNEKWGWYTVAAHASFLIVPTFVGLFAEPFYDYHETAGMEIFALLGCCKHYSGAGEIGDVLGFAETGSSMSTVTPLYGFSVEVNGVHYDSAYGNVYLEGFQKGDMLKIKIVKAPSLRADSRDELSDLVGVRFEESCP